MKLPKHVTLTIEHNPHASDYATAAQWLENNYARDFADVLDADEIKRTNEVWVVRWYPNTPVGFQCVAASTLIGALEFACRDEQTVDYAAEAR